MFLAVQVLEIPAGGRGLPLVLLTIIMKFDTYGQQRHLTIMFDDLVNRILTHTRQCYLAVLDPFFCEVISRKEGLLEVTKLQVN